MADILLLPVSKNKWPLYWNSTSGYYFNVFVIKMRFSTGLPNFIQIGPPLAELRRHIRFMTSYIFSKMAAVASEIYFRFPFYDIPHLRRSNAIRVPNFAIISLSTTEIIILPFSRNNRPSSWKSTSTLQCDHFASIGIWMCIGVLNSVWMGWSVTDLWRYIYFPRWRPRGRKSTSGFSFGEVSHLRRSKTDYPCTKFRQNILIQGWDITTSVFWKQRPPYWNSTSGFHFNVLSSWKCDSPLVYKISSKSNQRRSYDVVAIFKLAGVSHVGFTLG